MERGALDSGLAVEQLDIDADTQDCSGEGGGEAVASAPHSRQYSLESAGGPNAALAALVEQHSTSEGRFLALSLGGLVVSGICCIVCLATLGKAFQKPCEGTSLTNPEGYAEYTGCFGWGEWWLTVLSIVMGFLLFSALSYALDSSVRLAKMSLLGAKSALMSTALCFTVALLACILSWTLLMKPAQTYQCHDSGDTLPGNQWTIDVLQVFLGGAYFAAAVPFACVSAVTLVNVLCMSRLDSLAPRSEEDYAGTSTAAQENGARGLGVERDDDAPLLGGGDGVRAALPAKARPASCVDHICHVVGALAILGACFAMTTALSPIWNFSANSYFKSNSEYSVAWLPSGDELPCSLNNTCSSPCRLAGKTVPCYWFTFKIFPDTIAYYAFLAAVVLAGAAAHQCELQWTHRRLSLLKYCFPSGLTLLEVVALAGTILFFLWWFIFWTLLYARFHDTDAKHDCWPFADNHTIADFGSCPEGARSTGLGNLHVVCRSSGHMASLSFALTLLPVAKHNPLLSAVGLSWEQVLHWHRGLGAVAYAAVTLHMALWWLKWGLDGTLVHNMFSIDTHRWLWITPSWNHYENWSVTMAQVAWVFFSAALIIAWTVRRSMYRLFYLAHHAAIVFMLFGLMHAWSFWYFSVPGLALWIVDRAVRMVRASEPSRVVAFEVVPGTDITRLTFRAPAFARRFRPGQYAWVCVPAVSRSEYHPFTVNVSGDCVTFLCKAMERKAGRPPSWTRRLRDLASSRLVPRSQSAYLARGSLLVGPFAGVNMADLRRSPTILVAGGIGITPVISVFDAGLSLAIPDLTLVWAIRNPAMLDLPVVRDIIARGAHATAQGVSILIYLTRGGAQSVPAYANQGPNLQISEGRPDLDAIFHRIVSERSGSMRLNDGQGFSFACGPARLQETCVRCSNHHGFARIHTETFEF